MSLESRENRPTSREIERERDPSHTHQANSTGRCATTTQLTTHLVELGRRLTARGYSPATVKQYTGLLADFDRFLDTRGILDVRAVERRHIEAYAAELVGRKLSSSTRAQSLQAVVRLFDDLIDRGVLLTSPAAGLARLRRRVELPHRVPSRSEMQRLLAAPSERRRTGVRDRLILELLYGSALRIGELCALSLDDIDLGERVARVQRAKGGKQRVVPLTEAAVPALEQYLREARPRWAAVAARHLRPTTTALLLTNRGTPMNANAARQMLWAMCRKLRIERVSPHGLRHAAATHMVAAGADVRHVQELLGHASIASTQVYTRVVPMEIKRTHAATHPREQTR